jgi:transposase
MIAVGIDVAKRTHEACFMAADGRSLGKSLRFANSKAGVRLLVERMQALPGVGDVGGDPPFAPVGEVATIGLESTGHYWLALHDALVREGLAVQVLNPLQTHAYRRTTVRKTKTDRKDAWLVADMVRIGRGRAAYVPDDAILQLRELTRFRWALVDQIGDAKRKALTVLDRVFPEYEGLFSTPFIAGSRALLREATTAAEFAEADLGELTAVLERASRGRLGVAKAQVVRAAAEDSLGLERLGTVARFELQALLDQMAFLETQVAAAEREIERVLADAPDAPGSVGQAGTHLATLPGVSATVAASLLAEIGDITRFPRLESLVAYAGIDPTVYSSGEFTATAAHMSKRGSPHLRRALWLAANSASRWDPDLRAYLDRRVRSGKPWSVAMGAVSRKLLARVYAVLKEQRPYRAQEPVVPKAPRCST